MKIPDQLADFKKKMDADLETYLNEKMEEARLITPLGAELFRHIKDICVGKGKKMRGALVYFGYFACGGKGHDEDVFQVAMAMELIHSFLLIHDDIMDRDTKRRGCPTIHYRYSKMNRKNYAAKNREHFGNSMGIIAGILLSEVAKEAVLKTKFSSDVKNHLMLHLLDVIKEVNIGQMLDIFLEMREDATRNHVMKVHTYKTGKYSVEAPLHIGAMLANAPRKVMENLTAYAIPVGVAFQLQDDILGLFGDEKKIGKSVLSDLRQGKRTLLIVKALQNCSPSQRKIFEKTLGNPDITADDARKVKKIVEETGSLQYSKRLAKKLHKEAIEHLNPKFFSEEGFRFFKDLADFMIHRDV
ncbi:MAG: polyprenyl synthetase family protein [Parcubacteria group bacterium]|nr:polyprenyl synthetase family protein [Parcubacteria group bacterium]